MPRILVLVCGLVGIALIAGYSAREWFRAEMIPLATRSLVGDELHRTAIDSLTALQGSGFQIRNVHSESASCGRSLAYRLHTEVTCESYDEASFWVNAEGPEQVADAMALHGWQIVNVDVVDGRISASRIADHVLCGAVVLLEGEATLEPTSVASVRQVCTRVIHVL